MSRQQLADLYVGLQIEGFSKAKAYIDDVEKGMKRAAETAKKMEAQFRDGWKFDTAGFDKLGRLGKEFSKVWGASTSGAAQYGKEIARAAMNAQKFAAILKSGAYDVYAQAKAQLAARQATLDQQAALKDLQAQYGRVGGQIMSFDRSARVAFATAVGGTMAWVSAGMAGTVEAQRLSLGFERLNRGIAGIFKPTIDKATRGVEGLARWFEQMPGSQQRTIERMVVMAGIVAGGVLGINLLQRGWAMFSATLGGVSAWAMRTAVALDTLTTKTLGLRAAGVAAGGAGLMAGAAAFRRGGAAAAAGGGGGGLFAAGVGLASRALLPTAIAYAAYEGANMINDKGDGYGGLGDKTIGTIGRGLKQGWRNTVGRLYLSKKDREESLEYDRLTERDKWGLASGSERSRLNELKRARGETVEEKNDHTSVTPAATGFYSAESLYEHLANQTAMSSGEGNATVNFGALLEKVGQIASWLESLPKEAIAFANRLNQAPPAAN